MRLLQYHGHLFISEAPVITAYMGTNQHDENSWMPELPKCISPGIILEHLSWYSPVSTIRAIKRRYESDAEEVERLLVVNTSEAEQLRKDLKVPGFCCNAEIYQPDYIFRDCTDYDTDGRGFKYKAIYNARFAAFKRHYLSNGINNLRVLTGGKGESLGVGKGVETIDSLSHGQDEDLINKSVSFDKLTTEEVSAEINQSYCGLALSSVEGMMQASTEYLLCGRPVVSTRSTGGRDIYYSSENCKIVEDDPESVLQGVEYWLKNPPDRKLIRNRVLSQINGYRYFYCRKISQLQLSRGGLPERPERIFYDLFVNPEVYDRRFHASDSHISREKLTRLLAYPSTEILFKENNAYREKAKGNGLFIESKQHMIQLDELSAWILGQLNGVRTISEIINDLVLVYGDSDTINVDVRDTIARFIELDIVIIVNQVK